MTLHFLQRPMFILSVAILTFIAGPAAAQKTPSGSGSSFLDSPDVARFEAYLDGPVAHQGRLAHLRTVRDARHPGCSAEPTYTRIPAQGMEELGINWVLMLAGPPVFPPGAARPADYIWGEALEVNYCGEVVQDNVIAGYRGNNPVPVYVWQPPGASMADAVLTRDLIQQIARFATLSGASLSPPCRDRFNPMAAIRNTEVTNHDQRSGIWVERWTIDFCGAESVLDITLTPSARGGTDYSISPVSGPLFTIGGGNGNAAERPPGAESTYPGDDDDYD